MFKYIFFGFSKDEDKYLDEVEKDNSSVKGLKNIVSGTSIKKRFTLMSILCCVTIFLCLFLLKKLFNIVTIISILAAYFYTATHFSFSYIDYQHILHSKLFFITFFVVYVGLYIIKKIFVNDEAQEEIQKYGFNTENIKEIIEKESNINPSSYTMCLNEALQYMDYNNFVKALQKTHECLDMSLKEDISKQGLNCLIEELFKYDVLECHIGDKLDTIGEKCLSLFTENNSKKIHDYEYPYLSLFNNQELQDYEFEIYILGKSVFKGELNADDCQENKINVILNSFNNILEKYPLNTIHKEFRRLYDNVM